MVRGAGKFVRELFYCFGEGFAGCFIHVIMCKNMATNLVKRSELCLIRSLKADQLRRIQDRCHLFHLVHDSLR